MSLTRCISLSSIDPEDAADIRALVRAAGDPATGLQQYIDSIQRDMADLQAQVAPRTFNQPAYHGSPHIFDRFSTDFMGQGEGAQAFGWGLYFAQKKEIAEYYRNKLSSGSYESASDIAAEYLHAWNGDALMAVAALKNAMQGGDAVMGGAAAMIPDAIKMLENGERPTLKKGRLYKVDIPDDTELLAWDAPLSEQPEGVRDKIERMLTGIANAQAARGDEGGASRADALLNDDWSQLTGEQFYTRLGGVINPKFGATPDDLFSALDDLKKLTSLTLRDAAIPGHRFLDQGSRWTTGGEILFIKQDVKPGDNGKWRAKIKVTNRSTAWANSPGDSITTSKAYDTEAEAREWAEQKVNEGTYNYVIYDDSRINVLDFEQRQGEGARASITFPSGGLENGETLIQLFETANLSSFLHESGHFFLEAFRTLAEKPDAPQALKDDLAVINKFLGHEGGAYGVNAQETWARGFEAYLMEGKAPSLELADAFSRFKQWLVRIYKTVRGLDVKLNDEIRGVMDRMLATDAEIQAAREDAAMSPLFAEAPPGMGAGEFGIYQRLARRATVQAEQALLAKTMAKVRREREAWYKAERKDVRAEVEATVTSQREYRLIEAMANGVWIDGDTTTEVADMRLDKAELVERFGEGIIAELSRSKLGGKRAIYGGDMSVDEAASFFGFQSADEMVRILQNTVKRKDRIEQETDRIMTDRYGDPLNDGSIEEEALAAIHSEGQAMTVAAEARHLAKAAGRPTKNITAQIYRARARAMLGRMRVRDAIKPARFLEAERKAARTAQKEFARIAGGAGQEALAAAYQAKEQQLLNHYLYMEARDLEAVVSRGRERMREYDKPKVRQKIGAGYIEQIDALLADHEFRVLSQKEIDRRISLAQYVKIMETEAGESTGIFDANGEEILGQGRANDLNIDLRLIEQAQKKHYTRMSVDELMGLFDTIANIDHMGRFKGKLVERNRQRELRASVDRVVGQIEKNAGTGKADRNQGIGATARGMLDSILNADTVAIEYDGGDAMGVFYEEVKQSIDDGEADVQRRNVEMMTAHDALWKEHYTAREIQAMKKKTTGPNGYSWSKLEVIEAVSNMGNPEGLDRLLLPDAAPDRRLTMDHLEQMVASLDKRDMEFIQARLDLINSLWPDLSAVQKRREGVDPKKVDAVPIVHSTHGTFRGGYFPIFYDPTRSGKAAKNEESTFQKQQTMGRAKAQVKNGMTKQRAQRVRGMTLQFDPTTTIRHIRDTNRMIGLSEAVDATGRILNHPEVAQAFFDAGRKADWESLRLWLDDVAKGPIFNSDGWNATARAIKTNFTMAKLAFNLKTMALQVTGLSQSAVVVGKRRMLKAFMDYVAGNVSPEEMTNAVTSLSPFMAERRSTMQKDVYDIANDLKVVSPAAGAFTKGREAVFKWGFEGIVRIQFHLVDMPTWIAGYRAGWERFGNQEQAIRYADRMVARSQASGLMADRASMERGTLNQNTRQSDVVRLFTTLGSYMLNKFNRLRVEKIRMMNAESPGEVLNAALNMGILLFAEGVMMGLAYSMMADDDDEKDNSFAKFVLSEAAASLIGGVPIIRDVPSAFRGFSAGSPLDELVEAPAGFVTQIGQGENDLALWRSALDTVGVFTGLPTVQTMRLAAPLFEEDVPASEIFFGKNPLTR